MKILTAEKVYKVVKKIPSGKVSTYGRIAKLAGVKNPRLVGSILHKNIDSTHIPCHRVVNSQGKVASSYTFGGAKAHAAKLQKEGVQVVSGKVDINKFLWRQN